jgi:hypothetical protein
MFSTIRGLRALIMYDDSRKLNQGFTSSGYVTDECIGTSGCFPQFRTLRRVVKRHGSKHRAVSPVKTAR